MGTISQSAETSRQRPIVWVGTIQYDVTHEQPQMVQIRLDMAEVSPVRLSAREEHALEGLRNYQCIQCRRNGTREPIGRQSYDVQSTRLTIVSCNRA